jgi:hypothetical protein
MFVWLAPLAACSPGAPAPVPPRIDAPVEIAPATSHLSVPVTASLDALERGLERAVPRTLWRIDRTEKACVKALRVSTCLVPRLDCQGLKCRKTGCEVPVRNLKLTPDLSCRLVGVAERGPIRLSGAGDRLVLTMPVRARVSARDVGRIVSETATGAADFRAVARFDMRPDWRIRPQLDIDYRWTELPGAKVLGQTIVLRRAVDPKLRGVLDDLERRLEREIAALKLRGSAQSVWTEGFTVVELSRANPPAWLRLTPLGLGMAGYRIDGRTLALDLVADARIETFVGPRPADPKHAPLPPLTRVRPEPPRLDVTVPVLADYAELVPPLARALARLSAKPLVLPAVGAVGVRFGAVQVYATDAGRIAVGIDVAARRSSGLVRAANGRVWLTGVPVNEPGSQRVRVRDLDVVHRVDSKAVDLLLSIVRSPELLDELERALTEDFARDYDRIIGKARTAIGRRRLGAFELRAELPDVTNGRLQALGQGLFMPVAARGTATIRYRSPR